MAKSKRLNDVKSIVCQPVEKEYISKTVRKIDNGYVTSTYGAGSESSEIFTPEHPDKFSEKMGSGNPLSRAVKFMKD